MANIDTWLTQDHVRPSISGGPATPLRWSFSLAAGNQNDVIRLMNIPRGKIVRNAHQVVSATLGSSCTIQLRRGTTALVAASTAAGADEDKQNAADVPNTSSEDSLNVLIAGANVGATATVTITCDLV